MNNPNIVRGNARPRVIRTLSALVLIFGPILVIEITGPHEALARATLLMVNSVVGLLLLAFWALNRRTSIIKPGGKLYNSEGRGACEVLIRVMIGVLALGWGGMVVWPLVTDLVAWRTGRAAPKRVTLVIDRNGTVFGTWFLYQRLHTVNNGMSGPTIYLFYSLRPIQVGQKYTIQYLPRSKFGLDVSR